MNIVIVGGGTAGWSTALNFSSKTKSNITVISSKEIPIIGVGESTTGQFSDLIKNNLDEIDFFKKTGSTFKLGIKHINWKNGNDYFNSPLGYNNDYYDYYRLYHIAEKKKITSIQSALMENNQLPFIDNILIELNHTAYHLDTFKVGQYIKDYLIKEKKVNHIEEKIIKVNKDNNGYVTSLITESQKQIKADLFIDCSGFRRLLCDDVKFKSYEDNLLVNRAVTFHLKNKDDTIIKNYTQATALKNGWIWEIPLQHRKGCGYVFCDKFISDDEAIQEIEEYIGEKIEVQKIIPFNSGRLEKIYNKNVLTIGLSSAFVEPLEATSIHMSIFQVNYFIYCMEKGVKDYNKSICDKWDNIRDFIILHYRSERRDTEFWKEASSNDRLTDNLKHMLDLWKQRPPNGDDYNVFSNLALGNTLWLQILLGMNILDRSMIKQDLINCGLYNKAENEYIKTSKDVDYVKRNSINNNDFYKKSLMNIV
jgi:tryptophan halogenase